MKMSKFRKIASILLILGLAIGAIFTTFKVRSESDADIVVKLNETTERERNRSKTEN